MGVTVPLLQKRKRKTKTVTSPAASAVGMHLAVTLSAGKFALAHALPRLTERSGKSASVYRTKKERKNFFGEN